MLAKEKEPWHPMVFQTSVRGVVCGLGRRAAGGGTQWSAALSAACDKLIMIAFAMSMTFILHLHLSPAPVTCTCLLTPDA